jgi:hypothetical protein
VRLIPVRRATIRPHAWFMDAIELRAYRHTIETVNRHLEKMGSERLSARSNAGFELKVHATLRAYPKNWCTSSPVAWSPCVPSGYSDRLLEGNQKPGFVVS